MPEELEDAAPDDIPGFLITKICGFCGIGLYQKEVAAYFNGIYVDYDLRETTPCGAFFVLCGECRDRVKRAMQGNIDEAVQRRIELDFDHAPPEDHK